MSQKIHLQNGFIRRHGLHAEHLGADHRVLLFLLSRGFGRYRSRHECALPQFLGQTGLVLADLPLDGFDTLIQRVFVTGLLFLTAEEGTAGGDGNLQTFQIPHMAEFDDRLCFIIKEPVKF